MKVDGVSVKAAREVKAGEIIKIHKGAIEYTYKVVEPTEHRVGAALVPQYAENLTPQAELDKLKAPVETFFLTRDRGAGRPTKKDRRELEKLWDELD